MNTYQRTTEQSFVLMWVLIFLVKTQRRQLAYATIMGGYAALSSKAFAYTAYAREVFCRLCLRDFSLRQILELGNGHLMG